MINTFVAAINCMDGRVQEPVAAYMKQRFGVQYVDEITEPGVDKVLSCRSDFMRLSTIKERFMISVNLHGAKAVCVVGHHDCAGNPVEKSVHLAQIRESVREVATWSPEVTVIGLWVDEHWEVHEVQEEPEP